MSDNKIKPYFYFSLTFAHFFLHSLSLLLISFALFQLDFVRFGFYFFELNCMLTKWSSKFPGRCVGVQWQRLFWGWKLKYLSQKFSASYHGLKQTAIPFVKFFFCGCNVLIPLHKKKPFVVKVWGHSLVLLLPPSILYHGVVIMTIILSRGILWCERHWVFFQILIRQLVADSQTVAEWPIDRTLDRLA